MHVFLQNALLPSDLCMPLTTVAFDDFIYVGNARAKHVLSRYRYLGRCRYLCASMISPYGFDRHKGDYVHLDEGEPTNPDFEADPKSN